MYSKRQRADVFTSLAAHRLLLRSKICKEIIRPHLLLNGMHAVVAAWGRRHLGGSWLRCHGCRSRSRGGASTAVSAHAAARSNASHTTSAELGSHSSPGLVAKTCLTRDVLIVGLATQPLDAIGIFAGQMPSHGWCSGRSRGCCRSASIVAKARRRATRMTHTAGSASSPSDTTTRNGVGTKPGILARMRIPLRMELTLQLCETIIGIVGGGYGTGDGGGAGR
mmetsp:Transcript_19520/g.39539  ORF Transcript_19520/g.39539 Transcript_19520/m.39539 type:complete len:223 (+) Transcript_19520:255-923(+)